MTMTAVCIIPNCGRKCPDEEPFCSKHRDPPKGGLIEIAGRLEAAEVNTQALAALGRALLAALDLKHGSMCPANTCTCDLTETVAIMAASFRYALEAASPEES